MSFLVDKTELKTGLVIFRRGDVKHRHWYCRVKIPDVDRYKTFDLNTPDINTAKEKAFEHDADVRFRLKHGIPVFDKKFAEVAAEFIALQKDRCESKQISFHRHRVMQSHIKTQLNRFVGKLQITTLGQDRWDNYPSWRQKNGKGRSGGLVSDGTIRDEMSTFRSIMSFAAKRRYIPESNVFDGRLPTSKERREEFTSTEYRKLHTFARSWINEGLHWDNVWSRKAAYNFILIMTNTGMRTAEARNLRWRDIIHQVDKQGRPFVRLNVRGKGKFRELVAASNVATYLERMREISKATEPDDHVFTNPDGTPSKHLYYGTVERLLLDSGLMLSTTGKRRSAYCFRHTYATFRLSEGVDVYFLAKQMGTSVQMIEKHYGHITPVKNAERILQGMQGWEPIVNAPEGAIVKST